MTKFKKIIMLNNFYRFYNCWIIYYISLWMYPKQFDNFVNNLLKKISLLFKIMKNLNEMK